MSVAAKDEPGFAAHELNDTQEQNLLNRFRNIADPLKFLIVTSKLGTGFDAPIEGVMYLDKPLKLHTLFQTITRTNRPWTIPATAQAKTYGLVVDYIGLGDGFARAMKPADPDAAQAAGRRRRAARRVRRRADALLDRFIGIDRLAGDFASLEAAIERVPPGASRDRFGADFAYVEGIWEALAPGCPARTAQGRLPLGGQGLRGDHPQRRPERPALGATGRQDARSGARAHLRRAGAKPTLRRGHRRRTHR